MSWFPFALTTAFFTACQDLFSKKSLRVVDPLVVTVWLSTLSALLLGGMAWGLGIPDLQPGFWTVLVANGSLNSLAFLTYNRALQVGDLSLTAPIVAFSPLFFFITSPLIVAEYPTRSDLLGCVLVVAGSYGLNWDARRQGFWAPLRALWTQPGSRLMLGVALIWSVTANLDKAGVLRSSPIFWVFAVYGYMALTLGGLLIGQRLLAPRLRPRVAQPDPGHDCTNLPWAEPALETVLNPDAVSASASPRAIWPYLVIMTLCSTLAVAIQMYALTLTLVVRVIAVKRLSTLIGVVFGVVFLREGGLRHRLLGAAIMVAGVAVLLH
ncbi:MAG: EamA family transporter [Prochlorothrix sp.]|nr:EamA family transporter [Prochlorothrix sp.]